MSKHTPGNWYPYFDGEHWNVNLEGAEGFEREIVGCEGLYRCDGSDEANARLISAAPDLLEALQEIRDYIFVMKGRGHAYQVLVDSAIAKATGE